MAQEMNCKISPCIGIIKFPNPMDYASCDSLINLYISIYIYIYIYIYEKAHISVLDWHFSSGPPDLEIVFLGFGFSHQTMIF
jgi:hypothetical protein